MDTTPATTTKTERRARRRTGAGRLLLPLLMLAVAAPLLHFGTGGLLAALLEAPHGNTVEAARRGLEIPPERLIEAIDGLDAALRRHPNRERHVQLALLHQALAKHFDEDSPKRRAALNTAVDHFRAGLALAPLDPLSWTRLGWQLSLDGRHDESLAALRFSTLIGAHDPTQLWWRVELWLRHFRRLDEQDRSRLRRQLQLAFDQDPARLERLAGHYRLSYGVGHQLAEAGVERARLDEHFPIPMSLGGR